jgi:GNAT superfamily N-acetyltransferase/predicted DCC family thiol-disulfide oxidoreductase YuxK
MDGVFLYDGDCGFCTTSARWLQRHAISDAGVVAWQHVDLAAFGLIAEECSEAVRWVADGQRAAGPDAIAAYMQTSTLSWRTGGRVLAAPLSRHVTWPVYRWVARHRGQLRGGTPASELSRVSPPLKGIRRRGPKDIGACARLLRVVSSEGQYPVYWPRAPRAWLNDEDVIDAWIVERQGEVLGHIAISKVGLDAVSALRWREITGHRPSELAGVSRLFVRPRVRGQGIGAALLDVAVAEIRARGLIPVLDVPSASQDAIRLYEDRGWRLLARYSWGEKTDKLQIYYFGSPPEPMQPLRRVTSTVGR